MFVYWRMMIELETKLYPIIVHYEKYYEYSLKWFVTAL